MLELSLNILDIVTNSLSAGSTLVEIKVSVVRDESSMCLVIKDNGCGMDDEMLLRVIDPFFSTKKNSNVGLGIPLLKQRSELTGGSFSVSSKQGSGTVVSAMFKMDSLDFVPLGDIASLIIALTVANPSVDFVYTEEDEEKEFVFDTRVLRDNYACNTTVVCQDIELISKYFKENSVL